MSEGPRGARGEDSRVIREWGISLSSLEEVFLKLAARERDVNAPLEGAGGGAGGAPRAPPRRTCALCEAAPTAPVTVFNSKQLSVVAGDLLCADCAGRDAAAVESVRATAAAERRALLEGLDAAAKPPLLAAPPLPPLRGAVEEGGGEDVAGGAYRALPDADLALNDGGGAPGAPEPPPPVPFLVQFLAVLKLRLRTSAPPPSRARAFAAPLRASTWPWWWWRLFSPWLPRAPRHPSRWCTAVRGFGRTTPRAPPCAIGVFTLTAWLAP